MIAVTLIVSLAHRTKSIVFFSAAMAETNAASPNLKATFYVTNVSNRGVFLQVHAVERRSGSAWIADTQAVPLNVFRRFGRVDANSTAQLSFEFPYEPRPARLRVAVASDATVFQKAETGLRRLWLNIRGQAKYKEFWIPNMVVRTHETITPEIP